MKKMFGHRLKGKASGMGRDPGAPYNNARYEEGREDEESYNYVKSKDSPDEDRRNGYGRSKDAPPKYEGKEHVRYRDPGHTRHDIRHPEDEPHMKSRLSDGEEHEVEDNYHMSVPDETHYDLEAKLKRARMKMDAPNQQDPKPLVGQMTSNVPLRGVEDTSGEEEEGPNDMQGSGRSKKDRKKMIVSVMKRKMARNGPGAGANRPYSTVQESY